EFAHGVADGDGLVPGMLGDDAKVQRAHGRVAAHRAEGCHPQIAAHQVVAAAAQDVAARPACLAVAINTAGDFDGQHPEVGDQLARRREAVDVQDEGREYGGGDCTDAGNAGELVVVRQGLVGGNEQL